MVIKCSSDRANQQTSVTLNQQGIRDGATQVSMTVSPVLQIQGKSLKPSSSFICLSGMHILPLGTLRCSFTSLKPEFTLCQMQEAASEEKVKMQPSRLPCSPE